MPQFSRAFFRTSVVRLALIYISVFALITAVLFGSVYVLTLRAVDSATESLMDAQIQGLSEQYSTLGLRGLAAAIRGRSETLDRSRAVYLLADESLKPIVGNLDVWPQLSIQRDKWFEFVVNVSTEQGLEQHPIRAALVTLPDNYRLLIGTDVIERARLAAVMQRVGALAVVLLIFMGSVIAIWMNRRVLKQVHAIADAGQEIAKGDFARRLPVRGHGDELDELAGSLNDLLERIEQLTLALRFVIDGTAHDLRGPLNRLRLQLEQALAVAHPQGREPIEAALQDADALLRTLESLLRIAQAQSGAASAEIAELNLSTLATEIAELYAPLAEQRGITLRLGPLQQGLIQGSRQLLAHAVANLLDNAIKYTPAKGTVELQVRHVEKRIELIVQDTGPGIPADDRERVLQRFVRLDSAQAEPGTGLGLSLVAAVCRFHHASLALEEAEPGLRVILGFDAVS
ncbi:MAG: sensor histidine kinase [Steroidobacteraceae bacterium]